MISILNVRITPTTGLELLSNIKKGILVTPNVDHLVKLQKNRAFYNAYQEATHVVCDSRRYPRLSLAAGSSTNIANSTRMTAARGFLFSEEKLVSLKRQWTTSTAG